MAFRQIKTEAATAATDMLADLWPSARFPVDPVTIAERLGIIVMETDLPENVSGAIIKEAGHDAKIIVHYADSDARKRFTCAHELGHFVRNSCKAGEEYEYVDLRGDLAARGTDIEEIFANQFAANLLMPKDQIINLFEKGEMLYKMALFFGVSTGAMKFRLKSLNLQHNMAA